MAMHIANAKSLVAGSLVLVMAVKTMLQPTHVVFLHNFNLVLLPLVSALCLWHAFKGRRPLIGKSELDTSHWLGALSLALAVGFTFIGLKYRRQASEFLLAILFSAAAVFFYWTAFRERQSIASQDHS